ncbi:Transposable element Tc3 transposase [Lucilia cuprina]|nr:Transposable element Tc3 transposase [Lucilia cuprina]
MRHAGMRICYIAAATNRHRNTISNFLKDPRNYGSIKRIGRIPTVNQRTKRRIRHLAAEKNMSFHQIKVELDLNVTRQCIQQLIKADLGLRYENKIPKPRLAQHHKNARIAFEKFENVIYSDEKKFNLDGPDGLHKYWRDLCHPRQMCYNRNHGGGSLMVWAAFGALGKLNSEKYVESLENNLIDFAAELYGDNWTFQQDNAPIHVARHTKSFFESHNIPLLDWPALSPDLNPIDDLWGILSAKIFSKSKQYTTLKELKESIMTEWEKN